jgi:hypothetical protein
MSAEDLKEGTQNLVLWKNILHVNIDNAINATTSPSGKSKVSKGDSTSMDQWIGVVKAQISQIPSWGFLVDFKADALSEVNRIYEEQRLIRMVIEKTQKLVKDGNFAQARKEIQAMPDSSEDLQQFKKTLLDQIKDAEQQYQQKQKVEQVIKSAQQYVQQADFYSARRTVESLSGDFELQDLKQQLLSQINDAESGLKQEIRNVESRLQRKGISSSQIQSLASLNNVSTSDLGRYYGLLLAIERQAGGR